MPPGPWGPPLLGVSMSLNRSTPHLTYTERSKKYGEVISFTLFGTTRAVVISSESALREDYIDKQDHFSGNIHCKVMLSVQLLCD